MKKKNNQTIFVIAVILIGIVIFSPLVVAAADIDYDTLCTSDSGIRQAMRIVGYVIQIVRWIAPLIIIVLGMVDFGKAAISNDEKAMSKASGALVRRLVAGVAIFFIPTIVLAVLNAIEVTRGIEKDTDTQFGACTKCLFDPYNQCDVSGS